MDGEAVESDCEVPGCGDGEGYWVLGAVGGEIEGVESERTGGFYFLGLIGGDPNGVVSE